MRYALVAACLFLVACAPTESRSLYPDGKVKAVGQLDGRKQVGPWTYFHPDGQKQAEGGWVGDKQDGPWTWWYPDGKPQYAGAYSDHGLRTGPWKTWHADGSPESSGAYRLDRQDGPWTYWHPGGASYAAGAFDLGVKHGWWVKRSADGSPVESGLFVKGLKVGPWATWNAGTVHVQDLGAPAGFTAAWDGDAWTLKGPGTARVSFDARGVPTAVHLEFDGRTSDALPEDLVRFAADVASLKPKAAEPAAPATPAAKPVEALTSVASPVPLSAPVLPADDAQIETPIGGLSPTPLAPAVWSSGDEAKAPLLLKTYTAGKDALADDGYNWGDNGSKTGDPASRKLIGKMLPQTRFLSSTGSVIDLLRLKKPVVVCVMRGFSGQVCIYCATQTAAIANSYKRFTDAGAEVVIIYPGPTEAVPAFVQAVQTLRKDPPPMAIGLDVSLLLVRGLGVEENLAKPTSLILDPEGRVVYAYIGQSMADRPSVEDLLKALANVKK